MLQTRIRNTGYATSMDTVVAVFGGSAPFIATAMIAATENSLAPGFLLIGAALISSLVMVETAKQPLHDV
jgi:MFS transporter, MHS family, proline/betaine transporter